MSARITQLRNAVKTTHRCKAEHVKSVPVIEMFWQKVAWDGVVEVFRRTGHPKAKRCYAWSFTKGKETRFVTVLEIPPVGRFKLVSAEELSEVRRRLQIPAGTALK
jgi:hypothetical protein